MRFEKRKRPQTLPEGPKNHLANSRFHTSPIHPLKWRSNPNPCTKMRIQPYGSKECANFKRGTLSDLDEHPRILTLPYICQNEFSPEFLLSNTLEVAPQSYHIRGLDAKNIAGAIIPALMFGSHQNSVVKCAWARVLLGRVTSWEVLVSHLFFLFTTGYL